MTTLIGPSALNFCGLVSWYACTAMSTTAHRELNGAFVFNCFLFFIPEIDADKDYTQGSVSTMYSEARRPTPERALIDYMRHLDIFEEFYFVEGLREYVDTRKDLSTLREVAAHYGVSDALESWLIKIEDRSDCE